MTILRRLLRHHRVLAIVYVAPIFSFCAICINAATESISQFHDQTYVAGYQLCKSSHCACECKGTVYLHLFKSLRAFRVPHILSPLHACVLWSLASLAAAQALVHIPLDPSRHALLCSRSLGPASPTETYGCLQRIENLNQARRCKQLRVSPRGGKLLTRRVETDKRRDA